MLKVAKLAGIVFALAFMLSGCTAEIFSIGATSVNYQPSPTPLPLTATQAAELAQIQLTNVTGLPVTVEAVSPSEIAVRYTRLGEEVTPQAVIDIAQTFGGLLELNYTYIRTVTISTDTVNAQIPAATILAWYNQDVSSQQLVNMVLPDAVLPTPTPEPTPEPTVAPTTAPAPEGEAAPAPEGEAAPAPEGEAAPAPEGEAAPAPEGEAAPAPEGEAAPAPEGEAAPAPTAEATPAQ
jgi:hypothetical protein